MITGKLKSANLTSILNPQSTPTASFLPPPSLPYPLFHSQSHQQPQQRPTDRNAVVTENRLANTSTDGGRLSFEDPMDVAKASLMQMSEISRRASNWNVNSNAWNAEIQSQTPIQQFGNSIPTNMTHAEALTKIEEIYRGRMSNNNPQWATQHPQKQETNASTNEREYGSAPQPPLMNTQPQTDSQQEQPEMANANFWSAMNLQNEESSRAMMHDGLQVYTVGHLMPRNNTEEADNWNLDPSIASSPTYNPVSRRLQNQTVIETAVAHQQLSQEPGQQERTEAVEGVENEEEERVMPTPLNDSVIVPRQSSPVISSSTSSGAIPRTKRDPSTSITKGKNKLRVRRSTFVPGWTVSPRVLLVDDDAVSRKLGSKFLQVFGCTIDVAVDGVGAVNKMNLEKYDLVLMVSRISLSPSQSKFENSNRILSCLN